MSNTVERALYEGRLFSVKWRFDLAAGVVDDFVFSTPVDRDILVIERLIETDIGMEYIPYEDSDITIGSVVTTAVNLNSQNGVPTAVVVSNVTAVADVGTFLDQVTTPVGQGSSSSGGTFEAVGAARLLKRNTDHLLRFTSRESSKAGYIEYSLVYIEMN